MKPRQPDVAYCKKHREFVNELLEGRGWQDGDCVYTEDAELSDWEEGGIITNLKEDDEGNFVTRIGTSFGRSTDYTDQIYTHAGSAVEITQKCIWIPTEGDVLGMLAEALPRLGEGDYGWALEGANDADRYQAWIPDDQYEGTEFLDEDIYRTDWLETPLIALLELLRAVEGKG